MLEVSLGNHCTVTPACAFSYCLVRLSSPALSAAVAGPVFGGKTAFMTTEVNANAGPAPKNPGGPITGTSRGGYQREPYSLI